MRSLLFNIAYWVLSIFYTLAAALAALTPGRWAVGKVIKRYTRRMVGAMRVFAGIKLEARGKARLPEGAFIIAAKHQSWGDGFCVYSQFDDLAFVTGDHLERFPLFKTVLRKLGAIVVDNCGGPEARQALAASAADAHREGRKILIYPEGHLAPVGVYFRYRTGVYHMAKDFGLPVVPAASNLALFWEQESKKKTPGVAVLEFLEPLSPNLDKAEFMAKLEQAVEGRTAELIAEATGEPVKPAVLGVPEDERRRREEGVSA